MKISTALKTALVLCAMPYIVDLYYITGFHGTTIAVAVLATLVALFSVPTIKDEFEWM